jgi:hypothetical protein
MNNRFLVSGQKKFRFLNQQGTASGCLLFILIFLVVGYFGFKFGEAYWNYFEVRQKTRDTLSWAVAGPPKSEMDIVQQVIANVRGADVELTPRSIKIISSPDLLTVTVFWVRPIEFPYYTYPMNFKVSLTDQKRWYKGGLVIK